MLDKIGNVIKECKDSKIALIAFVGITTMFFISQCGSVNGNSTS
ncbi:hypothetical protein NYR79_03170 [Actinobacillus equuli subsp. haemolyticus]|nr:hypothetical protein [Actinobacillus equuli]WGE71878.1 hypothetical protein NYR79_03170 [Actinobacillus equuli subsp. haemolyticus]